jgi:mannonate dehydratase
MKLGFNLYRHLLTEDNFMFARQCGATHLVIHLVDYFPSQAVGKGQPVDDGSGWGPAGDPNHLWTEGELKDIVQRANACGLEIHAVENFDPAHWHDVLLDGPQRQSQLANIKTLIRRIGAAGIPVIGYNFSLAGVCGRISGPFARGKAQSVGMNGPFDKPLPPGMVWNMTYAAPDAATPVAPCTSDELWDRVRRFLDEVLPVAEEAGVALAAHPDDPPLPQVRGTPRLIYRPDDYQRLLNLNHSPANRVDLCLGSVAEMVDGDVYQTVDELSRGKHIGYIHFRNVIGKVPYYREVFPDEGDIDFRRVFRILRTNRFDGVIVPDHTPGMSCGAAWHAGMAFTMGYIKGLLDG